MTTPLPTPLPTIKIADDTTAVGLISEGDESADGLRGSSWLGAAGTITWSLTPPRWTSWSWTSGGRKWEASNHCASVGIMWRGALTSGSWASRLRRTCHGVQTPHGLSRRHSRNFSFWDSSEKPSVTKTACVIPPLLSRECVDILHVCVVCQMHSSREESTPEGHQHCQGDHWLLSPLPRWTVQCKVP